MSQTTITLAYPNSVNDPLFGGLEVWVATSSGTLTDAYCNANAPTMKVEGNTAVIPVDASNATYYAKVRSYSLIEGVEPGAYSAVLTVPVDKTTELADGVVKAQHMAVTLAGGNLLQNTGCDDYYQFQPAVGTRVSIPGWQWIKSDGSMTNIMSAAEASQSIAAYRLPNIVGNHNALKILRGTLSLFKYLWSPQASLQIGAPLVVSFSLRKTAGGNIPAAFTITAGGATATAMSGSPATVTTSWQRFSYQLIPVSTSAGVSVELAVGSTLSTEGVEIAAPMLAYADTYSGYVANYELSMLSYTGAIDANLQLPIVSPDRVRFVTNISSDTLQPIDVPCGSVMGFNGALGGYSFCSGFMFSGAGNKSTYSRSFALFSRSDGKVYYTKGATGDWDAARQLAFDDDLQAGLALINQVTAIPNAADLNDYTTTGVYHQSSNAQAGVGTNYPAALAGRLVVTAMGLMVYQEYEVYSAGGGKVYRRGRYNTAWGAWVEVARFSAGGGLTVYNSTSDGSENLTVNSFRPALNLIDRSASMASFRWAADNGFMRLEPDNADNGASWKTAQLLIDNEGRVTTGGGGFSSAVGLYVRPTALLNTTGYGVYARPTFDPAVQTVAGRVFTALPETTPVKTYNISMVAVTSNVVTITTNAAHERSVGDTVVVTATTRTAVNGTYVIATTPTPTTFTYAKTTANITAAADTGAVQVAETLARVDNYVALTPVIAAPLALTDINHFVAIGSSQTSIGTLRGFYSDIDAVSGKTRWNAYLGGTAPSYIEGQLRLGIVGANSSIAKLEVLSTSNMTTEHAIRVNNLADNYASGYGAYGLSNRLNPLNLNIDYTIDVGRHLDFKTANTQRMRLSSSGNLLLGSTTDNGVDALQVTGGAKVSGDMTASRFYGGMTHESGYLEIKPFNATYDNGRFFKGYFAGFDSDGSTVVNELRLYADSGLLNVRATGVIRSDAHFSVAGNKVVGTRETGWTAHSGTIAASKGAWVADTLAAASATYVQAEHTALRTFCNNLAARVKALESTMRTHGLIN